MRNSFAQAWERIAEPENQAHIAHAYWRIVVAASLTLGIAAAAYGIYEYMMPVAPADESVVSPPSQTLSQDELKAAIDKLDARSARFQELIDD